METFHLIKPFLEFTATAFVIYRTYLFFLRHRNYLTLSSLAAVFIFFLSEIPSSLKAFPHYETFCTILTGTLFFMLTFQPEIGWFLKQTTQQNPEKKFLAANGPLDEIVKACRILASSKTGALLAIKRNDNLNPYIEKSVVIDALIRHELLLTIFTPPTYLHDGGAILSYDRIVSCAAIFPLTQNSPLKKKMGTRHRAALGLSEETDAFCIVVSEETGTVSLADRGKLFYDIKADQLRSFIEKSMYFRKISQNPTE